MHGVLVRRLRVFEKRVLMGIFRPKREGLSWEWRKIHNDLNDLYSSPNIARVIKIEKNEMGWVCSAYNEEERRIQGFGGEI